MIMKNDSMIYELEFEWMDLLLKKRQAMREETDLEEDSFYRNQGRGDLQLLLFFLTDFQVYCMKNHLGRLL
jgi:hypothetical protein